MKFLREPEIWSEVRKSSKMVAFRRTLFLVLHFNFLFVPCGRLSWLPVSFLLHVKHTHYRIVLQGADGDLTARTFSY